MSKATKRKIKEAIRILNSHNHWDSKSKSWAIQRCIHYLEDEFNIKDNIIDDVIEQGWGGEL